MAMENLSSHPIGKHVAMALAVIPRDGVRFLQMGRERIPVTRDPLSRNPAGTDPLQAAYFIEGQEIQLRDGRAEAQAAPGSATKIKTSVFGLPAYGDLNGDDLDDAALFLLHQPGGTGSFYYVAAALNVKGTFLGTPTVLLGDRIAPQTIEIRNGVIIANYADRRPGEPMAKPPSIARSACLVVLEGKLVDAEP
jgi:hypothetical protein